MSRESCPPDNGAANGGSSPVAVPWDEVGRGRPIHHALLMGGGGKPDTNSDERHSVPKGANAPSNTPTSQASESADSMKASAASTPHSEQMGSKGEATVPSMNRRAVPFSEDPTVNRKERRRLIDERRQLAPMVTPALSATPSPTLMGDTDGAGTSVTAPRDGLERRRPIRHVLVGGGGKPTAISTEEKGRNASDPTPSAIARAEISHETLPPQLQQASQFCNQSQLLKLQSYVLQPQENNSAHRPTATQQFLSASLDPAPIPANPLDDNLESSSPAMKEMAWVLEESTLMLPPNSKDAASRDELVLDFAWKHGSLRLREYLHKAYPSEVSAIVERLTSDANAGIGDRPTVVKFAGCNQDVFCKLREEARNALRLGYRRSDAMEKELNCILYSRWKDAVEELGEPGNCSMVDPFKPKQTRHRRRRRRTKNEALLEKALGQDKRDEKLPDGLQSVSIEAAALDIPPELTPLEDEVAWLVEESLILLPDDMLSNGKATTCFLSAGLVTKSCEIKWDFVAKHASEELKSVFERMGGLKRRPLQRIIRYHQTEVKISFAKRRDDIASLLLLRGYRRPETKDYLPSHDILITTGLNKVWAVRLLRRRQNEQSEDIASSKDLRSACNERVGDKRRSESSPARQKKPKKPKLAATQKAQSTILTAEEEEIAWLQEENKHETGVAIYDWEFIEENSSVPLLIDLAERKVAPSIFPSVPGVSKLSEMIRLDEPRVKEEYDRIRVNIRYAITQKGYRRDRSQHLPAIPAAPASFLQKPKRKTCVVDVEYAGPCAKKSGGASTNACADVGKKANGSIPQKSTLTDSVCDNLETEGERALAFETDDYFTPDTNRVLPEGRTWYCDFCKTAQFDDYDEAVLHESYCDRNVDRCMPVEERIDEKANDTRAFQPTGEHAKQEGSDSDGLEQDAKLDSFDLHLSGEEESGEEEVVNDGDEEFTLDSDDELDEEFIEE